MTHKPGDKIPTALVRDPENRTKVLPEITPGCEWVFAGEGVPTRKWNGTCVMLDDNGKWWARREVKPGKTPPENYMPINFDEVTGKTQGWEPIEQSSYYKYFLEALDWYTWTDEVFRGETYELLGPKINGDPDLFGYHTLRKHDDAPVLEELNFAFPPQTVMIALEVLCEREGIEGVVWHHPDGRMAKLKVRDL